MVTRRRVVFALGAGALAPLASFAQQQTSKVFRIGFLGATAASDSGWRVDALRAGLRDLGYVEGKNVVVEYRWSEGNNDRLPEIAAELVRLKVDVIITHGTPGTRAAKQATTTIPIVMALSGDAVANGLITSLARPGGNITGTTFLDPELSAKRLELLKDLNPRINRVAVLVNSRNPGIVPTLRVMEVTAAHLKMKLEKFEVQSPDEIAGAIAAMAKRRVDAVWIHQDTLLQAHVNEISSLAAKQRLPSIGWKEFAEAGGLIGYGANNPELFRRAAYFVDKILKGAKPGDIPVEQPTRFELIINLKTAKALKIKLPEMLVQRADRVIE